MYLGERVRDVCFGSTSTLQDVNAVVNGILVVSVDGRNKLVIILVRHRYGRVKIVLECPYLGCGRGTLEERKVI